MNLRTKLLRGVLNKTGWVGNNIDNGEFFNLYKMSKVYNAVVNTVDKVVPTRFQSLWSHPAGPKTIFFWAPTMKWCLVIAGLGDVNRPAEKLSLFQSTALALTGIIWSRYSLVITPKNYNLFFVNLFVGSTGLFQLSKIYAHRKHLEEQKQLAEKKA